MSTYKKPFRFGVHILSAKDLGLQANKTPVKPEPVKETVVEPVVPEEKPIVEEPKVEPEPVVEEPITTPEPIVEEPVAEEPVTESEETTTETDLEAAGFSKRSIQNLNKNEIYTVEALQKFIDEGGVLEDLDSIGAKGAKTIQEELAAWTTVTNDQNSQGKTTQDS